VFPYPERNEGGRARDTWGVRILQLTAAPFNFSTFNLPTFNCGIEKTASAQNETVP
jgi:hypothetical protein